MNTELTYAVLKEGYRRIVRKALFRLYRGDPDQTHEMMIRLLAKLPAARTVKTYHPTRVAGINFPNRVGLAAGLDKDGLAAHVWGRFGFGFAELGTVTALAQPGNPKPRLFRLRSSQAIINRMGFNNLGAQALADRLAQRGLLRGSGPIPLGISIGKSKIVELKQASADYLHSLQILSPYADYFAINISSPNTPGLRTLQHPKELASLIEALVGQTHQLSADPAPLFVKLAPDLTVEEVKQIVSVVEDAGGAGFIATNTTWSRNGLSAADQKWAVQEGGMSGRPITEMSRRFVAQLRDHTKLPIIGVGGIMSAADAAAMFDAGANLIQLYTGFIFEGPGLIYEINHLS